MVLRAVYFHNWQVIGTVLCGNCVTEVEKQCTGRPSFTVSIDGEYFQDMRHLFKDLHKKRKKKKRQTFLAAVSDRNNVESLVACLEGVVDDPDPRVEPQMRYQRALSRLMTFDNMRKRLIDDESARRVTSCSLCDGFHTRSSAKCTAKDY